MVREQRQKEAGRNVSGLNQSGSRGGDEKWLEPGHMSKYSQRDLMMG